MRQGLSCLHDAHNASIDLVHALLFDSLVCLFSLSCRFSALDCVDAKAAQLVAEFRVEVKRIAWPNGRPALFLANHAGFAQAQRRKRQAQFLFRLNACNIQQLFKRQLAIRPGLRAVKGQQCNGLHH